MFMKREISAIFLVYSVFFFSAGSGVPLKYSAGLDPTSLNYFDLIDECGLSSGERPVSVESKTVGIGEHPWIARLVYDPPVSIFPSDEPASLCGGALITTTFVLTAKHCIKSRLTAVALGDYNLTSTAYCFGDLCADPPQNFLIKRFIKHRTYDVAIIVLKTPVKFTLYIRPICLPWNNTDLVSDTGIGQVAGWEVKDNLYSHREYTSLHTHLMTNINKTLCRKQLELIINKEQFCAGGHLDQGICRGVDGGPLIKYATKDGKRTYFVVGVSSFGGGVCEGQGPKGFVNTSHILKWLFKVMEPVDEQPKTLFQHYFYI